MNQDYEAKKLIELFNDEFKDDYSTILVGGGEEPLYEPASQIKRFNQITFTRDYFSSALHEVAHWCIAGQERLQQLDYGYWYAPDGRSAEQQRLFESVETKPQALEWIFSTAAHVPFKVSVDNLNGNATASDLFKDSIYQQVMSYCQHGLPQRAERFVKVLVCSYGKNGYGKTGFDKNGHDENNCWEGEVLNPNRYSLLAL